MPDTPIKNNQQRIKEITESIEKGIAYLAEHHVKTEVLRDGRIHPDGRA